MSETPKAEVAGREKRETRETRIHSPLDGESELSLPLSFIEWCEKEGYKHRWCSFQQEGRDNTKRITSLMQKGYKFVQLQDLPKDVTEDMEYYFPIGVSQVNLGSTVKVNKTICVGDVALAIIPVELFDARQAKKLEHVRKLDEADILKMRNSRRDLDRVAPIVDESYQGY